MISPSPIFNTTKEIKAELDKIPHLGYGFLSKDKKIVYPLFIFIWYFK